MECTLFFQQMQGEVMCSNSEFSAGTVWFLVWYVFQSSLEKTPPNHTFCKIYSNEQSPYLQNMTESANSQCQYPKTLAHGLQSFWICKIFYSNWTLQWNCQSEGNNIEVLNLRWTNKWMGHLLQCHYQLSSEYLQPPPLIPASCTPGV